jgi:hypothetical protein
MLNRRDLLALELAIPVATRSMPITSNITESIIIIEKIAGPMYSIYDKGKCYADSSWDYLQHSKPWRDFF